MISEANTARLGAQMLSGAEMEVDMTLPLQTLFDDMITFISKTDFE